MSEVWADCDYTPLTPTYERCRHCGNDRLLQHHCDLQTEITQLRGMIWWLASDLAADDGDENSTTETWIELAERHWRLGLRFESRPLTPRVT